MRRLRDLESFNILQHHDNFFSSWAKYVLYCVRRVSRLSLQPFQSCHQLRMSKLCCQDHDQFSPEQSKAGYRSFEDAIRPVASIVILSICINVFAKHALVPRIRKDELLGSMSPKSSRLRENLFMPGRKRSNVTCTCEV